MDIIFSLIIALSESEQPSWEMLKLITDTQFNLAMYGTLLLIAIVGIIAGVTWGTSSWLARRQLRDAMKSLKSEMAKGRQEDFAKHTERITNEIEKAEKQVGASIEKKLILLHADQSRLYAYPNMQQKNWNQACNWLVTAIEGYVKIETGPGLRGAVDGLNLCLIKCDKLDDDTVRRVESCLPLIPGLLRKEREEIREKLDNLPKKKTKDS